MWRPDRPPSMRIIREAAREIGRKFRVERVILFGSRARGKARKDSDVDLLVIACTRSRIELAAKIHWHLGGRFPTDVLVRTPREVKRALRQRDPFLTEVLREGVVLYATRRTRVG